MKSMPCRGAQVKLPKSEVARLIELGFLVDPGVTALPLTRGNTAH